MTGQQHRLDGQRHASEVHDLIHHCGKAKNTMFPRLAIGTDEHRLIANRDHARGRKSDSAQDPDRVPHPTLRIHEGVLPVRAVFTGQNGAVMLKTGTSLLFECDKTMARPKHLRQTTVTFTRGLSERPREAVTARCSDPIPPRSERGRIRCNAP